MYESSSYYTSLPTLGITSLLNFKTGVQCYCVVVFMCISLVANSKYFHELIGHLYIFFREAFLQIFCPCFHLIVLLLSWWVLHIIWIQILWQTNVLSTFSPILCLAVFPLNFWRANYPLTHTLWRLNYPKTIGGQSMIFSTELTLHLYHILNFWTFNPAPLVWLSTLL